MLDDVAVRALYKCLDWVALGHLNRPSRGSMRIGYVHLIFTLQLLTNLVNTPCGRREFFSTDTVTEQVRLFFLYHINMNTTTTTGPT